MAETGLSFICWLVEGCMTCHASWMTDLAFAEHMLTQYDYELQERDSKCSSALVSDAVGALIKGLVIVSLYKWD